MSDHNIEQDLDLYRKATDTVPSGHLMDRLMKVPAVSEKSRPSILEALKIFLPQAVVLATACIVGVYLGIDPTVLPFTDEELQATDIFFYDQDSNFIADQLQDAEL